MRHLALLMIFWLSFNPVHATEPWRVNTAEPIPELEKLFQQSETWLGADGDYAVTLDERRTLWFFRRYLAGQAR